MQLTVPGKESRPKQWDNLFILQLGWTFVGFTHSQNSLVINFLLEGKYWIKTFKRWQLSPPMQRGLKMYPSFLKFIFKFLLFSWPGAAAGGANPGFFCFFVLLFSL